jgi:hypothetical protein
MRWSLSVLMGVVIFASVSVVHPTHAKAAPNPVVLENQQTGTTAWRIGALVSDDSTGQIKGYASATSVNQGDTINLFVTVTPAQTFTVDIYRIGWYGGPGGRLRLHQPGLQGIHQQACASDATTGLIACHWTPSLTVTIPSDWTSGIYLALLTNSVGYQNYIPFAVKDGRAAAYLFQEAVATSLAYNNYPNDGLTGKSLYAYQSSGAPTVAGDARAVKVSFDRPFSRDGSGFFLTYDVQVVRWLEMSGYDVTYSTDVDTHANAGALRTNKAFLVSGHDEYWSREMYDNVTAARDAGVNVAFLGADAISWQVRFEPSDTGVPNRVMVCYKDATTDPVQGPTTTVRWRNPVLNRPEQTLSGVMVDGMVAWGNNADYVVQNSSHWAYAGTGLKDGDKVPGMVGYEMDRFVSNYPAPNSTNQTLLSWSPFINYNGAANYSNSSIYQAPSGAWVFATGTQSWSWMLDPWMPGDQRIRQMTANILNAFVLGAPTASSLSITAPSAAPAGQSFGVTVSAKNSLGNPATQYNGTVHFTSSDTSAGVMLPPDAKLTNGSGSFNVTLIKSGVQTLTVSDAANSLSGTVSVTINARLATHLTLTLASTTATAGSPLSFTVAAADQYGNPDPTYAGTLHFTTSDTSPGVVVPPDTSLTNGVGTFSATFAAAGPQTLTASDRAGTFSVTANLTVNGAPATRFVVTATSGTTTTAGVSFGFTVIAQDQFANIDTAYAGTVHFSSSDTLPGVSLPANSPLTSGKGTFAATLDRAGSQTVTATDTANGSVAGTLTMLVNPAPASHLSVTKSSSGPATAGNSFNFAVVALDPFGNRDTNYSGTLHFTSSDTLPGVSLPRDSPLTGGQGTFSATLDRAGSQTISVSDTAQPAISGAMTVQVLPAAAAGFWIDGPTSVAANQGFAIRVTAFDRFGNVASGYRGTVHFSTSDLLASTLGNMPPDYAFTAGDGGGHTFTTSLVTVGGQTISAVDTANAGINGSRSIYVSLL